ncbi:MAG: hypothetical protein ACR2IN_03980 [Thermoleophilaceae bacterium]
MPRLGKLYPAYEPKIRELPRRRAITEADLLKPSFRLEQDGPMEIFYAPMDWLRPQARVAVVGITPGKGTMRIAFQTARDGLIAGRSGNRVLDDVKAEASFSGFRVTLGGWLDWLGLPHHLGIRSSQELWDPKNRRLLHPTSAIRYPVLVRAGNYSGQSPMMTRHPTLRRYLFETLAPELEQIPHALVIPLGVRVGEALEMLIAEGYLDGARCLVDFPHPSGANAHQHEQWPASRDALKRRMRTWFKAHPTA